MNCIIQLLKRVFIYFFVVLGVCVFSDVNVKAEDNNIHVVDMITGENKEFDFEKDVSDDLNINIPAKQSKLDMFAENVDLGIDTQSVIGDDDRILVKNVTAYPYTATARLIVTYKDGTRGYASGFMIGPRLLATAGHVLINDKNSHLKSAVVEFGLYKKGNYFYKTENIVEYIYYGGYDGYDPDTDYGFLVLGSDVGTQITGTFGIITKIDPGASVAASGYPGGKPYMYVANGKVIQVRADVILHNADTSEGESGGPLYYLTKEREAYAYGMTSGSASTYNIARRLNASLVGWLEDNGYFK